MLFGSSYPFRPIKQFMYDFAVPEFDDYVFEKLFYENAVKIFNFYFKKFMCGK
jgi:predicted TIM-barrel fold metal-dependent hydrolase